MLCFPTQYAFQDDENMFMVLDLMLGGDLRFHLDRSGNMREEVVRFYVAELACALDYLHRLQIVHRDIKPDNVLLDEKGHVHLTDFNIAVHFSTKRPLTSIAGSMAYMAPEVLAKRGYLNSVDWWSLGVMAYELLFGRRPFRGKTNSALTHSIMNDRCGFPENVDTLVTRDTISCISGLLERDTRKRMGARNGLDDFKAHPWFEGLDWEALMRKELNPPFEPDAKKANFDATHELEELLLEDNPLKAKKRDEKRDINTLSPEMRQMEEHFLPFDHLKQMRRSYFKTSRPKSEAQQTTSAVYTLQDQPFAEMSSSYAVGRTSSSAEPGTGSVNGSAIPSTSTSTQPSSAHLHRNHLQPQSSLPSRQLSNAQMYRSPSSGGGDVDGGAFGGGGGSGEAGSHPHPSSMAHAASAEEEVMTGSQQGYALKEMGHRAVR